MARVAARISFAAQQQPSGATADIRDASGRTVATAELHEDAGKVQLALVLPSPSTLTGKHGLHVMEIGRCDASDFASAGRIFNPLSKKHGLLASGGPMVGDLPNLTLPLQRYNAPALGDTLSPEPASLLGPNGTALVIYAGQDDGLTDPEGNPGARIACGVITGARQMAAGSGLTSTAPPAASRNPGLTLGPASSSSSSRAPDRRRTPAAAPAATLKRAILAGRDRRLAARLATKTSRASTRSGCHSGCQRWLTVRPSSRNASFAFVVLKTRPPVSLAIAAGCACRRRSWKAPAAGGLQNHWFRYAVRRRR
jgi:superoxide dismutase, Cu-Zn family